MPRSKQVHSLYFQCLNSVLKTLQSAIEENVDFRTRERLRKYYVTNLHGGIREHVLKLAALTQERIVIHGGIKGNTVVEGESRTFINVILNLIDILVDSSVTYLCPVLEEGIISSEYSMLMQTLKTRECTGLKSLFLKIRYSNCKENDEKIVVESNKLFHSLLVKGLAKNLTVLVLEGCCDNEILKLLGQHCTHLSKLDVTNSWFVNDNGFKYLCLKDPHRFGNICEGETHTPQLLLKLMSLKTERLNPCCFTLYDVRMQDTNTSDLTVLMLLIFIKNLKTLGGFIYFRSVGDNIVFLSRLARTSLKLNLTELWDTHLTDSKLKHLSAVLPNLTVIYTRSMHLQPLVAKFDKLTDITIDFDFKFYEDAFFNFLSSSGKQLRKISLIDQVGYLDLSRILEICPNLREISGAVTVDHNSKQIQAAYLVKARIKVTEANTIIWIFNNVPNLQYFEIQLQYPIDYYHYHANLTEFDDNCLQKIIRRKPECFETLQHFIVKISDPGAGTFRPKTIFKFISECKQLKLIGDFMTWNVNDKIVEKIQSKLKNKNFHVEIMYRDAVVPHITMQSIREFHPLRNSYKAFVPLHFRM